MKTWGIYKAFLLAAVLGLTACAPEEQTVDKRQAKLADLDAIPAVQTPALPQAPAAPVAPAPVIVIPEVIKEVNFVAPALAASTVFKDIPVADILLINKISEAETMIYLKGGKSYSYKPDAALATDKLKPIVGVVKTLATETLYSLSNSDFWYVGPSSVNVRSPGSEGGANIPTMSFKAAEFGGGDISKMKVLYVSVASIILQLDTHIVILTLTFDAEKKETKANRRLFELAKLPFKVTGAIQAGRKDDGFWLKSDEGIHFLVQNEVAGTSPWSKSALTLAPAGITSLGMWPDATNVKTLGATVALSPTGLISHVPAAAAPVAATATTKTP